MYALYLSLSLSLSLSLIFAVPYTSRAPYPSGFVVYISNPRDLFTISVSIIFAPLYGSSLSSNYIYCLLVYCIVLFFGCIRFVHFAVFSFSVDNNWLVDPEVTANIYCKSRNLHNTDTQNYTTDFRFLLGHPVIKVIEYKFPCVCTK